MYLICWSQHLSVTLSVTNQKNWPKTPHNMILTNVHFVQITGFYVIFAFCWLLFFHHHHCCPLPLPQSSSSSSSSSSSRSIHTCDKTRHAACRKEHEKKEVQNKRRINRFQENSIK